MGADKFNGMRAMNRCFAVLSLIVATAAMGQSAAPATPAQMVAQQQSAIARLPRMDGVWRGTGWMVDRPEDKPRQMTMTYRVGPFLDRTVKVIEIRGYLADGSLGFHAFNMVSFDSDKRAYVMNARAAGRSGAFDFELSPEGYVWRIGSGDSGLRYTGTIKDGVWKETGQSLAPGRTPVAMSEFTLRRVADTDWPEAGAVAAK